MRQIILPIMETTTVLNISYNSAYAMFHQSGFPRFRLFNSYYVRTDRLYKWLKDHGLQSYCPQQWIDEFDKQLDYYEEKKK